MYICSLAGREAQLQSRDGELYLISTERVSPSLVARSPTLTSFKDTPGKHASLPFSRAAFASWAWEHELSGPAAVSNALNRQTQTTAVACERWLERLFVADWQTSRRRPLQHGSLAMLCFSSAARTQALPYNAGS